MAKGKSIFKIILTILVLFAFGAFVSSVIDNISIFAGGESFTELVFSSYSNSSVYIDLPNYAYISNLTLNISDIRGNELKTNDTLLITLGDANGDIDDIFIYDDIAYFANVIPGPDIVSAVNLTSFYNFHNITNIFNSILYEIRANENKLYASSGTQFFIFNRSNLLSTKNMTFLNSILALDENGGEVFIRTKNCCPGRMTVLNSSDYPY